ncbi:hypothetical protein DPEC_G00258930 [Dallia pectoralis]|uniref:Uncharacterized protein n=1 Tax=Dallia pectoralis TaxID=75939 RepID=A0ACC2FRH8_DALPE|nr:hypothetical protein DPEC_G00258930 [Dallia pectoralis]
MGFLRKVAGLSLRDRVRSSVIREELGVEPLLLCVERSQLRWFGHLVRMPPGRLPREVFQARPAGRRPRGRPRTSTVVCIRFEGSYRVNDTSDASKDILYCLHPLVSAASFHGAKVKQPEW